MEVESCRKMEGERKSSGFYAVSPAIGDSNPTALITATGGPMRHGIFSGTRRRKLPVTKER